MQKIARSAEPAEECRDGKAVNRGEAVRAAMRVDVGRVPDVEVADVKVREASGHREEAEDKTDDETDEVEGVHIIWCSALLFFASRLWEDSRMVDLGTQDVEEAV